MASGKFGHIASAQPGDVKYFAAAAAPQGWIKANGALVSRIAYASLFAAIGTAYGAGDGSTTFALPDLRGEFLRGFDDGRGIDSGRSFGTAQLDELKEHSHTYLRTDDGGVGSSGWMITQLTRSSIESGLAGGTETRPRNIAMLACIKY